MRDLPGKKQTRRILLLYVDTVGSQRRVKDCICRIKGRLQDELIFVLGMEE